MILQNKTVYNTAALRKLLSAVHEHMAKSEGRLRGWSGEEYYSYRKGTRVRVVTTFQVTYSRGNYVSGHAFINGCDSVLRLARPGKVIRSSTYGKFIWLAYHEMMHLYGYLHPQFVDIQDEEIATILSPLGHTLNGPIPLTIDQEGRMQVKISGTSFAAVDLKGLKIDSQKEVKRGKGVYVVLEVTPAVAGQVLDRLHAKDVADAGLTYEQRYACRSDARRLDKQISQAEELEAAS